MMLSSHHAAAFAPAAVPQLSFQLRGRGSPCYSCIAPHTHAYVRRQQAPASTSGHTRRRTGHVGEHGGQEPRRDAAGSFLCGAARRRAIRYDDDDEEGDNDEGYGHNSEIAMIEAYSALARDEALLVRANVDGQEELVLVFKGFSSCLTSSTASDPARSVLPARAVIQCIDVIRGPFDPSNIEYIEKGLTWEAFRSRLQSNIQ